MSVSPPQKKSTDHTEDTEKDFCRMIKTTPSALRLQTSDFRPQTSAFKPQPSNLRLQVTILTAYSITAFEMQNRTYTTMTFADLIVGKWNCPHVFCLPSFPFRQTVLNILIISLEFALYNGNYK